MKRLPPALVLLLALTACGSGGHPPRPSPPVVATTSAAGFPRPDHVVIVIFENKAYEQIAGNAAAPYLNGLAARAAVFTDAHAVTHPSQPNYLALFSGSTHGVTDDSCPVRLTGQPSLARQLLDAGLSFGGYSEDLPAAGYRGCSQGGYAAKHNPFVYFRSVQDGLKAGAKNIVGFQGEGGLYEDLSAGKVPAFSFIAPNQCNDQHGRGNGGSQCDFDFQTDGTQAGLNPALIYVGDLELRNIVHAIHASRAWQQGHSAIVVVYDENDYSLAPNNNQVLTVVETNHGRGGRSSNRFYTHFSLLKSLEAGLGLPCLNHACDQSTSVMSDLFGGDE